MRPPRNLTLAESLLTASNPVATYEEVDEGHHGEKGKSAPSLSVLTLLVTAQEAKFGKANQQCYDQMIGYPCHLQG